MSIDYPLAFSIVLLVLSSVFELVEKICDIVHLMKIFAEMLPFHWSSFACREADESRLREVCESFLGPPVGMAGSVSSMDPKNPVWDPDVLVSFLFLGVFMTMFSSLNLCF